MKSKKTIIIVLAAAIFFSGLIFAFYEWNKPARDVTEEKGIQIAAVAIFDSFTVNERKAGAFYFDKAIQVTGEITEIKNNQAGETVVYLKSNDPIYGVNCTFKENPGALSKGDIITFKGVCTGFLSDVIINQGIIIK